MAAKNRIEISIENLNLDYHIRRKKGDAGSTSLHALDNINLSVREGEFLSVVGPSGCGKSTLLYILAGLQKKTSGVVKIGDAEITGPSLHTGIIMQAYALFPWRTIKKNVEFGLEVKGLSKAKRSEIAAEYIELVGLSEFSDRYPYELSGGMKQRIAIARALAYDPDVLLMDEPFAAVDEQTRSLLHEELLRIWEATNKTIVFVTHSIEEAIFLSDRVAVMTHSPGQIREIIDIDLKRPREASIKSGEEFSKYRKHVWQLLQTIGDSTVETFDDKGRFVLDSQPQEVAI